MPRKVVTPENLTKDFVIDLMLPGGKVVQLNLNTSQFSRDPMTGMISITPDALTGFDNTFTGDLSIVSNDSASAAGPHLYLRRNSSSPAANDQIGALYFDGKDSAGNVTTYALVGGYIVDPTNGSEDGGMIFKVVLAGAEVQAMKLSNKSNLGIGSGDPEDYNPNYNHLVVGTGLPSNSGATLVGTSTVTLQMTNGPESSYTHRGGLVYDMGLGRLAIGADLANPFIYTFDASSAYNGRVGIGNQTPAYALDVTGEINASGNLRVNGVPVVVGTRYYGRLSSDLVLPNDLNLHPAFNFGPSSSGAVNLAVGTYHFEAVIIMDNLSTSASSAIGFAFAGTAVRATEIYSVVGRKTGTIGSPGITASEGVVLNNANVQMSASGSGAQGGWVLHGTFQVTAAGTVIPSVRQLTASVGTATVLAPSYIIIERLGDVSEFYSAGWV
jgi:hypothetical protein